MKLTASKRSAGLQNNRAEEIIAREAARFIAREAGNESLITVIRAESSRSRTKDGTKRIMIFVSVFPTEKSRLALAFLERQREAFSNYLKDNTDIRLPRIDFMLDNSAQVVV